ncbi:hypothetical protein NIES2111_21130 [Nostoc sp. NIES-2111]|nr:hypothetical protein NIES2111_21130 [Nostoc sp. NIES-2111]
MVLVWEKGSDFSLSYRKVNVKPNPLAPFPGREGGKVRKKAGTVSAKILIGSS